MPRDAAPSSRCLRTLLLRDLLINVALPAPDMLDLTIVLTCLRSPPILN